MKKGRARGEDDQRERGNKRERGSRTESDGELRQKGQQFFSPGEDKKHRLYLSAEKFKKHIHKINISSLHRHHVQTHTCRFFSLEFREVLKFVEDFVHCSLQYEFMLVF